jgi:enoyl-CoA hydratase/carnithine racemase
LTSLPRGFDKMYREGKKVLATLVDIPVPVIAAVNGPATVHSEYVLLADFVIATPDTVFQDNLTSPLALCRATASIPCGLK